jgi:hypothetical protein
LFTVFLLATKLRYPLPVSQTLPSPVDKTDNHDLALNSAIDLTRNKPELILENMLLRQ